MSAFALLFGMLLLGALMRAAAWMPAGTPEVLNAWVLRIALPALILVQIPRIGLDASLAFAALGPWLVFAGSWLVFASLAPRLGWSRRRTGAVVLTCGLGNTAFMGLPMIHALFGAPALGVAVIADQLGSFLALSTGGALVAALYSGQSLSGPAIATRVLIFPPFLALMVALLVAATGGWPPWVAEVLDRIAATLTPTALFAVGFGLRLGHARQVLAPLGLGLSWKLALAPALVLLLAALLGIPDPVSRVTVAQCAMAPMITAGILAADADLEPPLAATIVGVGVLVSLLSVPAWAWLL